MTTYKEGKSIYLNVNKANECRKGGMFMRKIAYVVMLVTLAVFVATSAFALPSSKFAAHVKDLVIVEDATSQAWTTVLTADIKTPNKKDLLIGASFETGIYTRTKVKGKGGDPLTASAEGNLQIRVLYDYCCRQHRWCAYKSFTKGSNL